MAEEDALDFIERWLHVSPDGGNGTVEVIIYLIPILIGVYAAARRIWLR